MRRKLLPAIAIVVTLACTMPIFDSAPAGPVVITVVATPDPALRTEPTGLIVYTCFPEGFDQICLMNADGANQRRLTTNRATDFYPSLAPGGAPGGGYIVFSSRRGGAFDIYRMDTDGANVTRLTTGFGDNYAPAVSPSGAQIVFVSTVLGTEDLWLMDAGGGNAVRLTDWPGHEIDPSWSPDGAQISFTSNNSGTNELYVIGAAGANVRQVTSGSGQRESGRNDWSPDGLTLAFYAGLLRDKNIFAVPASCTSCPSTQIAQITSGGNNKAPSYSPDGAWIVFAAGNETGDKTNDIIIMRIDGSDRRQLTTAPYAEWQPRWGR
jgi:TolB protein